MSFLEFMPTNRYNHQCTIFNKKGIQLGEIGYCDIWKKYVVFFEVETQFDEVCLLEITNKLKELNKK